ncbi:MAG: nucleotidyltransferase domain-containing protein [Ferruginibacter sp.]
MLIRNKDKETLLRIFSSVNNVMDIWAYGSRVNGTAHDSSDLDLVLRSHDGEKLPIDLLVTVREKIQESNIPILVELFDWARLPESFRSNIELHHEVFFSNKETHLNDSHPEYKKTPGN